MLYRCYFRDLGSLVSIDFYFYYIVIVKSIIWLKGFDKFIIYL